jgi:hypothetical protein
MEELVMFNGDLMPEQLPRSRDNEITPEKHRDTGRLFDCNSEFKKELHFEISTCPAG